MDVGTIEAPVDGNGFFLVTVVAGEDVDVVGSRCENVRGSGKLGGGHGECTGTTTGQRCMARSLLQPFHTSGGLEVILGRRGLALGNHGFMVEFPETRSTKIVSELVLMMLILIEISLMTSAGIAAPLAIGDRREQVIYGGNRRWGGNFRQKSCF